MKRAVAILIPLLCIAASHKKIQSPKAAEQAAMSGKTMLSKSVAMITPVPFVIVRTNIVSRIRFAWDEDTNDLPLVSTFTFYMGRSPGVYDYWTDDIGTNLSYTFSRTNWDEERMNRHFFVVTAKDTNGVESLPSNEVHYPPFGPDHFLLTWTSNWDQVTIYETTDIRTPRTNWTLTATVVGTNTYSDWIDFNVPCKFFSLDKPDTLTITAFNPNP